MAGLRFRYSLPFLPVRRESGTTIHDRYRRLANTTQGGIAFGVVIYRGAWASLPYR